MYQDLNTRHDRPVISGIVDLPIKLKGNSKRISSNSSSPLRTQNEKIGVASKTLLTRVTLPLRRWPIEGFIVVE